MSNLLTLFNCQLHAIGNTSFQLNLRKDIYVPFNDSRESNATDSLELFLNKICVLQFIQVIHFYMKTHPRENLRYIIKTTLRAECDNLSELIQVAWI